MIKNQNNSWKKKDGCKASEGKNKVVRYSIENTEKIRIYSKKWVLRSLIFLDLVFLIQVFKNYS